MSFHRNSRPLLDAKNEIVEGLFDAAFEDLPTLGSVKLSTVESWELCDENEYFIKALADCRSCYDEGCDWYMDFCDEGCAVSHSDECADLDGDPYWDEYDLDID